MKVKMKLSKEFRSGYWRALNRVLSLLNTYETRSILKKDIYHAVFEMRPEK